MGAELPPVAAATEVIEIKSITDTLNGAFMATLEVRWRRWRLLGDGFWARFKDTEPMPPPFATGTWEVSLAYGDVGLAYELPWHPGFAIDVTAEARWWRLSGGIELVETLPPDTLGLQVKVVWADFVAGVRLRRQLTEKWRVWAQSDVGGGAAKIDWSAEAGLGAPGEGVVMYPTAAG